MSFVEGAPDSANGNGEEAPSHSRTPAPSREKIVPPDTGAEMVPAYAIRAHINQVRFHREEAVRSGMPDFQADLHWDQLAVHTAELESYGVGAEFIPETSLSQDALDKDAAAAAAVKMEAAVARATATAVILGAETGAATAETEVQAEEQPSPALTQTAEPAPRPAPAITPAFAH